MQAWLFVVLVLGALGVLAAHAYARPRGVYLRSVAGFFAVTLGWALIWLLLSPSNEAGFGFFAIWIVLAALAFVLTVTACAGATARYIVDGMRAR
jgi:hypothetical protein